jgi:hypothetical protein
MTTRIPYLDELLAALGQPGCALCRLLDGHANRLIDAILFEMVNDVKMRDDLNAARGLCRRHAPLLVRTGSALGAATMMQGVVKVLLRELDGGEATTGSRLRALLSGGQKDAPAAEGLAAALAAQASCPVCAYESTYAGHYTQTLLRHAQPGSDLLTAYEASDGLCLPHFRDVLTTAAPGPAPAPLLAAQRAIWSRLNDELEEFLRKSDYRFQKEPFGAERDSWQRAISAVSGQLPGQETP